MARTHIATSFRRRLVTATIVGLLLMGTPAARAETLRPPPALVRVQDGPSAGAIAWRELVGPYRTMLN